MSAPAIPLPFDADTPEERCAETLMHEGHAWSAGAAVLYCEGITL